MTNKECENINQCFRDFYRFPRVRSFLAGLTAPTLRNLSAVEWLRGFHAGSYERETLAFGSRKSYRREWERVGSPHAVTRASVATRSSDRRGRRFKGDVATPRACFPDRTSFFFFVYHSILPNRSTRCRKSRRSRLRAKIIPGTIRNIFVQPKFLTIFSFNASHFCCARWFFGLIWTVCQDSSILGCAFALGSYTLRDPEEMKLLARVDGVNDQRERGIGSTCAVRRDDSHPVRRTHTHTCLDIRTRI